MKTKEVLKTSENKINSPKSNSKHFDLYQIVTDKMISLLEKGVSPWQKTWSCYGLARNAYSGHIYSGINALILNLMCDHPIPYFMSFKQVKAQGGNIKKGASSEQVFYYNTDFKDSNGNRISEKEYNILLESGAKPQRNSFLKYFRVFNIADIEGIEFKLPQVEFNDHSRIKNCEAILENFEDKPQLVFANADQPYYSPSNDHLNMPEMKQFKTPDAYYSVLFHELIHSTGHQSRLNRDGIIDVKPFGSSDYSKEELIAELGASFLRAIAGIDCYPLQANSAAYLNGWLSVLKSDNRMIFKAAAHAQKAVDYITIQS